MTSSQPRALFVHQGFELYGSDRSFIQSIKAFRRQYPQSHITAILPRKGPLLPVLETVADTVYVEPLLVPRAAEAMQFFLTAPWRVPLSLWRALKHIRRCDFLYINTIKPVDYMIAARFSGKPAIVHFREIFPTAIGRMLERLALFSKAVMVFNSQATANSFSAATLKDPIVIYNGVAKPEHCPPLDYRGKLHVLFLGRLNDWKGQKILVEAVNRLEPADKENIQVRIAGDVYQHQIHHKQQLLQCIEQHGLQDNVSVEPFTKDVSPLLSWAHVLVVPSIKPEPFGRVAAEAMSFGRPVIASAHGGLVEIVEDGVSGYLFPPGNADALARRLHQLLSGKADIPALGKAASERHAALFSAEAYEKNMAALYARCLSQ